MNFPPEQNPQILTENVKRIVLNKLKLYRPNGRDQTSNWESQLSQLEAFLMDHRSSLNTDGMFLEFWKKVQMHDTYRKESFKETFPEFYEILQTEDGYKIIIDDCRKIWIG